MTRKALLAAALAALSLPAAAVVKVAALNGTIQVKTDKGVVTVSAGQEVPPIPDGAEITVVSGEVALESGGVAVRADAGDSFSVTGGKGGGLQVAAIGEKTTLTVVAGKSVTTLGGGSTVSVLSHPRRGAIVAVMAGKASVSIEGRAPVALAAGESARAPAAGAAPSQRPAAPDSLPAKISVPASSPVQEKATSTCDQTVSPSSPCN